MFALLFLVAAARPTPIVITNVTVVRPGTTKSVSGQTVVVDFGKITAVGKSGDVRTPVGATVVDGRGKFLIPGLWDMHVHVFEPKSLSLFTANGVTGVRSMFGEPSQLEWRRQTDSGEIVGPRMVVGSPIVDGPKPVWPGSIAVANEEQGRAAVRKIKADGYDFVKVYSLLDRKSFFAIADECKKQRFPFAGHVPYGVGLVEAAKTGMRTSEHLMGLALASTPKGEELRAKIDPVLAEGMTKAAEAARPLTAEATASFDKKTYDKAMDDLAKSKFWQCPTLVVLRSIAYLDEAKRDDPRLKYMSPLVTSSWDPTKDFRFKNRTKEDWAAAKANYQKNAAHLKEMRKRGVPILAGTDCLNPFVFPGFSLADELALLVEAGYPPTEALAAATTSPAAFLGRSRTAGKIAKGYQADLVLLDADPLADIANVKRVIAVVQRGRLFDRAALDALLKAAENPSGQGQAGLCDCGD